MYVTAETRGVARLQAWAGLILALIAFTVSGWIGAVSALLGAIIVLGSGLLFAWVAGLRFGRASSAAFLALLFVAEMAKLLFVVIALLLVWLLFGKVSWLWEIAGCIAALSAYWLTLLINSRRR